MTSKVKPSISKYLPWDHLYTVERSGIAERSIHGITLSLTKYNSDEDIHGFYRGDVDTPLWTRSLLKPFQLLLLLPTLYETYPELTEKHLAMMMASHQGDPVQMTLLEEIIKIGQLSEEILQCSACQPMSPKNHTDHPSALHHPCSGKHLGLLLWLKAKGHKTDDYLNPEALIYDDLKTLIRFLLDDSPDSDFYETTDGCGMPNLALSAIQLAKLYQTLTQPIVPQQLKNAPEQIQDAVHRWSDVYEIMRLYPELIGGENRLDTELITGKYSKEDTYIIAKEGADGLLCVGIKPTDRYPSGVGILIKTAHGYESAVLKTLIEKELEHLDLNKHDSLISFKKQQLKTRFEPHTDFAEDDE